MTEPVYAFRRRGQDDFCTCTFKRYTELSDFPEKFEMRIFYTAPQPSPTAQAAESVLRDLTDPLGEAGTKIMGHVRIYAQRQYEAGRASHGQAPAHVLHLVQEAFAEVAMAYPKAFALHKVGLADTAVRKALATPSPQAAQQAPAGAWMECRYGSGGKEGYEGWSIVSKEGRSLVAYLGRGVEPDAVTEIVMTHNAAPTAMDSCTDPYNCKRCKAHPDHRSGLDHAGIPAARAAQKEKPHDL